MYFSISICWIYTGIDASKCAYCEVFDGLHHMQLINIFKNPINQRASQMHQIHTSYLVNAQNYDFSNRNRVGPGPISTYETHTQSHITICLIRYKISSVSYKNKQVDPGCPAECWLMFSSCAWINSCYAFIVEHALIIVCARLRAQDLMSDREAKNAAVREYMS